MNKKKFSRRDFLKNSMVAGTGLVIGQQLLSSPNLAEAATGGFIPPVQGPASNPIVIENAKPGTTEWEASNPAQNREIEGYASLTSVNRGGQISFYVNTTAATYTIEVFRLGWYGGAGGRQMTTPVTLPGIRQTLPSPDPVTGLIECRWTNPYVLSIPNNTTDPTDWLSGIYIAKLKTSSGRQSNIMFIVRDDARPSAYMFQSSVTNNQAYNAWGGKSLYAYNSPSGPALEVSFNRPYDDGYGTAHFLNEWSGWEHNMQRFLEREGYDVSYCTNVDVHEQPGLLLKHKGFLSVGHDEYWSWEMRSNVEAARDQGVNLAFFSANTCYWQVRLEPSRANGAANRTMVCYKDEYARDPLFTDGNASNNHLVTRLWRQNSVKPPEDALLGVMFDYYPVDADIIIENSSHWIYANTGLRDGDRLAGLCGYEADRMFANAPAGTVRLAHSPLVADNGPGFSDMTIYTAASGAVVFATGTIQWSWGLDDYNANIVHNNRVSAAAQQITRNVLTRFDAATTPPPPPPPPPPPSTNLIVTENAKAGTTAWQLSNPATNREIEGYASLTSVNRGGQISFYVNTTASSYTIEVFRMGWYGGAGARQVLAPVQRTGLRQTIPSPDPATGLIECRWTDPYVLTIPANPTDPTDWLSGVYLAKLTAGTSGKQSFIIFAVRDDARTSNLLFQMSVTTYQAYNNWGGKSLYGHNSVDGPSYKVSFNRPYALGMIPDSAAGLGAGEFITNMQPSYETNAAAWEYNLVRFLEREGYDVTYCTNVDTHATGTVLLNHKAFLSVGHDEYWSWQMRQNVEAARDQGISIGFFSANTCYWQIRFEPSPANGAPNRTVVGYKFDYQEDPLYKDSDPSNNYLVTTQWRMNPVNRPEDTMMGVMYDYDPVNTDMVIENASHWVCAGTGLKNGDKLRGLVGYEVDMSYDSNNPPGKTLIAHSPFQYSSGPTGYSDMVTYTAPSGATVLAVGTQQWTWGLDDYNSPALRPVLTHPAAQQMTRNILQRFIGSSSGNKTATTTQLVSNQNPATPGQSVTFTATVTGQGGTPSGSVEFFDGATSLGRVNLTSGSAALTTSVLSAGSHSITAVYSGDTQFNASTSLALTQTVGSAKAPTSTSISTSVNPSTAGQAVTFTAQVTASSGAPSGTVQFFDGTTSLGTANLSSGRATLTTSALSAGSHSITATYNGDTNFNGSTSPALPQTVNAAKAATSTSLSSSVNPSIVGQAVTFTAQVTSSSGTPGGTVQFFDGATSLGTANLSSGRATLTTSALSAGSHSITAVYSGNASFQGSTSPARSQTVNATKAATSTSLSSSRNPSRRNQSVTFTVQVTASGGGVPGGTVTFKDGSATISTKTLNGSGQATFTTSSLSVGWHNITAVYSGNANFQGSTSPVLSQRVRNS